MEPSDVDRAFLEWCAMMGVASGFRLARDASGKVRIEELGEGGARAVGPAMTPAELCRAIELVHESMKIKTVQVARTVAKRRRPRR